MGFMEFKEAIQKHFEEMTNDQTHLFIMQVDKDEMWNLYLDSFPDGTNNIFRERREHDCSCCHHFINEIGAVVKVENGAITTIWDCEVEDPTYKVVAEALSNYVKVHDIRDIYLSPLPFVGTNFNYETLEDGKTLKWDHFHLKLPSVLVNNSGASIAEKQGQFRDMKNVFKRSLEEISEESVLTVLELISQNSLYKGEEWEYALKTFLSYKQEYMKLRFQKRYMN